MNDPVADLLTRIRNAYGAGHNRVALPTSKVKEAVAKILAEKGYVGKVTVSGQGRGRTLVIDLKYVQGMPIISGVKQESKPGKRVYRGVGELPRVLNGEGMAIVSTSKGIMSSQEAKKRGLGGELLAKVW